MLVFYSNKKINSTYTVACVSDCAAVCLKPKNKCCSKYKKKGVNCKRCPKILLKQAS